MSERAWWRSLYWRIAMGFIALFAAVLLAQVAAFVWTVSRAPEPPPARVPGFHARAVAIELSEALEADPGVDVGRFVRERVDPLARGLVVVFRDGRVVASRGAEPPDWLVREIRERFERLARGERAPDGRPLRRPMAGLAPVRVRGELVAVAAVLPTRPARAIAFDLGPRLLAVAGLLALIGTVVGAIVIFGPAHRRLRALEHAARQLGAGDAAARAPETGGDEIASVAVAFNQMAAELTRRMTQIEAADRARRQLLADVSHELMTPLTSIRGYVETLRMPGLPLDQTARDRYLGIVLGEALGLERLIGDLLDLSRFEAGGVTLSVGIGSSGDLVSRIVARHERVAAEKGIALETRVETGAETVEADLDRLEQAVQNLVANAVRHTPAGGRVTVTVRREAAWTAIDVADTGEGIAAEHLPLVFDRFYKADPSRRGLSGLSGLGLAIVKAIAERHGGDVTVRSKPGVETIFTMRLPGSGPAVPAAAAARPS
jgi:two-component system, OmpR family, sensor kinase